VGLVFVARDGLVRRGPWRILNEQPFVWVDGDGWLRKRSPGVAVERRVMALAMVIVPQALAHGLRSHGSMGAGSMVSIRQGVRKLLGSPAGTLVVSLLAASLFAWWTIRHLDGERRVFWLYYFVPIGVPFVAYLLDRMEQCSASRWGQYAVDLPVLALSLARAKWPVPLISGHMLFLVYALLTTRSIVAQVAAALVLAEVIYLKIFAWGDWVTLIGGLLVASGAAFVFRRGWTDHRSSG
jgi:hypothetical protein